jgi:gliding motility-associated-like protein
MKQYYKMLPIFFMMVFSVNGRAGALPPPVVNFTFTNDNTCSGTAMQFTSTVTGDGPFIYAWDFSDSSVSSLANPSHVFTSLGCSTVPFTVKLTVTDANTNVTLVSNIVSVQQKPDINFKDVNASAPVNYFSNCQSASASNPTYSITVGNTSVSTCVSSYSISWGDLSPIINNVSFPISHTYNQLGAYNMIITAYGQNGCNNSKTYIVKNVSNPSGGINSPGSTQNLCIPTPQIQFTISNWVNNSPGTLYSVDYGDNSTDLQLTQEQLVASPFYNVSNPSASGNYPVPYSYNTTSCPNSQFTVTLTVTNACGTTPATVSNITTLSKPVANFTNPPVACISSPVSFSNTSVPGYDAGCDTTTRYIWNFGDPGSGALNVVDTDYITSIPNASHTFSAPGNYTVTLSAQNTCGVTTKAQQICIEGPITPQFNLSALTGCAPTSVTAANTTPTTSSCTPPTYLWAVTYSAANCGTVSNWSFANGTTASSANPVFNFVAPGTYSITLTATNSCGSQNTSQSVVIKKPPTAQINAIPDYCGTAAISPTAVVNNCAPSANTITYAWSFPGGAPATANTLNPGTITYSNSGNYTVSLVVTNECGASSTATELFAVNVAPALSNTVLSQMVCSGQQTTPITLTSATAGATFSWTATATAGISGFTASGTGSTIPGQTITTTSASAGTVTYVITPSLGICSGTAVNYVITVNPAPNFTAQPVSATVCQNATLSALSVTVSNAASPTYQWYANSANNTAGTLIPGATNATYTPPTNTVGTVYYYCVITLPPGGCSSLTSAIAAISVTAPPAITAQPLSSQDLCIGVTLPSALTINYNGGTGTATYQWYSNTTNSNTGGSAIPGATSPNYIPPVFTAAGVYYYYAVVTLSGNGCNSVTSAVAEVNVFADPVIDVQPLTSQSLCQGATPVLLSVTASGGNGTFSYQWFSNATNNNTLGTLIPGANGNTFTPPAATVGTNYYYCIVSQPATPGCSVTSATAQITVIAAPIITTQPLSSTVCAGGTPTVLSVAYTNGVGTPSYQWYSNTVNDNTTGTPITDEINPTYSPPAALVGMVYYYCIITLPSSGGCSSIASNTAAVTVNAGAVIDIQPAPVQELCVGGSILPALTVNYTGGTGTASYQWYSNTTNSTSGGTLLSGATGAQYTPPALTSPGTFYYYAMISFSGNGCGALTSNSAQVNVLPDPIIVAEPLATQTVCQDVVPATLVVSGTGGIGAFSYQWYSNTNNSNINGILIPGAIADTYTPPTSSVGTIYYYCIISNGPGCSATSATAAVIVNLAPAFTLQPVSETLCLGQSPAPLAVAYANGAGAPQYQWYSNSVNANVGGSPVSGATNPTFNPPASAAGTIFYYCVITLPSGGCSALTSQVAEITINENPVIASVSQVICSSNVFTVTPDSSGGDIVPTGTTYTWTMPVVNPAGAISGMSGENNPQSAISQTLTNLTTSPATVTYTVVPISGVCPGQPFTVTVTVNPSISPNITLANSTCYNAHNGSIQTNITGGIPFTSGAPYGISWTGPNGFSSSAAAISGLEPGTYTLTVTDAGGCPFSNTYTITEPAEIIITTDLEKDITCYNAADGAVQVTVTGGTTPYSYSWTKDTLPFAAVEDISALAPGTYGLSVTDSNNCGPVTISFTITEPPLLTVSLMGQTNAQCYGESSGAATIAVAGGVPVEVQVGVFDYLYSWTGPNGFTANTQNLAGITAGTYNLTVTDNSACVQTLTVIITQPSEILVNVTTTPITCYGANNASINLAVSGDFPPFTASWDNFASGTFQDNLSAGDYIITITDATGCQKIVNVNIPEAPVFMVNPVVNQISCFGAHNGSINLNFVGGIAPVSLTWSDGSTSGTVRNNLGPGTYTVTIIDGTPCSIIRTFVLVEPQALALTANVTNALDCDDANSGAINLLVSGGTPPFSYDWGNGVTTEDLANVPAGNYLVTVTDSRNCITTAQFTITRQPPIVIAVETQTDFNCESHSVNQNFVAHVSGGIPPYQLQWSSGTVSGANNEIMHTDVNGTVLLTVTDSYGCIMEYPLVVDTPELGYASFVTESYAHTTYGIYSIDDPIQFTGNATGDYVSIIWDFGDGTFSNELNPVHTYINPRDYVVTMTVTYPFGCVYIQTISLMVEKGYLLVVPNAFTPNEDGLNDTFRPVTKALKNVRLDIYDTWGSLIYSEEGETLRGWDGSLKGKHSENGNYYCRVEAQTFYGTTVSESHPFVLIR